MPFLGFGKEKSLEELQEDEQREKVQLSIDQMRALRARLRKEGLTLERSFGGNISAALRWLKEH